MKKMEKKPVKDVFGLWLLKDAEFSGKYEFPVVHGTSRIPKKLVQFSKCEKESETQGKAVHFYELDEKFVSCLGNKRKLLKKIETFRRYESIILPDFSVYRDFPLAMQIFQVYKSRAVGNFLMQNGIKVIPNIRWGDERTYSFAFDGIEKYGVVSVGVQGAYRDSENERYFEKGFIKMLEAIEPETVLCYGNLSDAMKYECKRRLVNVKEYGTEISKRMKLRTDLQRKLF